MNCSIFFCGRNKNSRRNKTKNIILKTYKSFGRNKLTGTDFIDRLIVHFKAGIFNSLLNDMIYLVMNLEVTGICNFAKINKLVLFLKNLQHVFFKIDYRTILFKILGTMDQTHLKIKHDIYFVNCMAAGKKVSDPLGCAVIFIFIILQGHYYKAALFQIINIIVLCITD